MIIDCDAHYTPHPEIFNHPEIQDWYKNYRNKKIHSFTDLETRRQEFDRLHVDKQVLNFMGISLGMNYQLPAAIGVRIMQIYNQHMSEITSTDPRFDANIWLALQDLDASLEELELRSQQNFFAAFISEAPVWGFMPQYDRLFATAQRLNIPLYLHQTEPTDSIYADMSQWSLELEILTDAFPGQHYWKRTIASLIIANVFERYPALRIVIAERDIDWIADFQKTMLQMGFRDPLPYFKSNFWFTTEPEMPNFIKNAEFIGWNRMLFATDWPHDKDMGGSNSLNDVSSVNSLKILPSLKQRIYSKNYLSLKNRC